VGGGRRVGFHALHHRMFSCVEGSGVFVCLDWVRLPTRGPRLWACGFSVAAWLVVVGLVGMAWVWVGCGRDLCRFGEGSEGVGGEGGSEELFGLGLGRLSVWRMWGWGVMGNGLVAGTSGVMALCGCVGIVEGEGVGSKAVWGR